MCSTFHFHSSSGGIFEFFFLSPFSKKGHKRINDILTTRKVHSEQSLTKQTFSLSCRNGNFRAENIRVMCVDDYSTFLKPFAAAGSHMVSIFSDFHCGRLLPMARTAFRVQVHQHRHISSRNPFNPIAEDARRVYRCGWAAWGKSPRITPFDRLLRKCWLTDAV